MDDKCDVDFERDRVCYEQNCLQFRSLNQTMWQVPVIAMTLTGGLWFGASIDRVGDLRYLLLILAFLGNAGLCVVLIRMRYIIGKYLEKIREFHPPGFVEAKGEGRLSGQRTVVRTFQILLVAASIFSIVGMVILACSAK